MTCDFLVKYSKVLTGVALGRVVAAAGQEPLAVPPAIGCPCSYSLSLPIALCSPLTHPMPFHCPNATPVPSVPCQGQARSSPVPSAFLRRIPSLCSLRNPFFLSEPFPRERNDQSHIPRACTLEDHPAGAPPHDSTVGQKQQEQGRRFRSSLSPLLGAGSANSSAPCPSYPSRLPHPETPIPTKTGFL